MSRELKKCPFCGGTAVASRIYATSDYEIICTECGTTVMPFCAVSENVAANAWNKRGRENDTYNQDMAGIFQKA